MTKRPPPQPDSVLRVMMCWKAVREPEKISPQKITFLVRESFTVVEWGGVEVKN